EGLVRDLSHLRAEKFVVLKGGPNAKMKLADKEAPLKIEVVLADGKPKTLTVGALSDDKTGYYAQCSDVPAGVVFLVPERTFAPILRGITHFSRERPLAQ